LPKIVRLFFSVRLAFEIDSSHSIAPLMDEVRQLGPELKPVSDGSMHVTLKFLGDTRDELIDDLSLLLIDAASAVDPFSLPLHGLGVFPNERRPAVLWTGLQDTEPLKQLASSLDVVASELGFEKERRNYHPHLTLARIKSQPAKRFFEFLESHRETEFGRLDVDSIELMQSELLPTGAKYTTVATANLSSVN
jgi:RNA 2',3'-cyclic 3'-phosphodiesterase